MASSGRGHRDGVDITAIGVLYNGPLEKKYWSSSRGKEKYPYPIGYQATRWHGGHSYSMEVSEGPRGPLFSVTCEEGIACSGQTPSTPWEDILKKRHAGAKKISIRGSATGIDGPEMFGFTNPLVQRLCRELVVSASCLAERNVGGADPNVRDARSPLDSGKSGDPAESSGKSPKSPKSSKFSKSPKSPKKVRRVTQLIMSEDTKSTKSDPVLEDDETQEKEKSSAGRDIQEIENELSKESEGKLKISPGKNSKRAARLKSKFSPEDGANSLVSTSGGGDVPRRNMPTKRPRSARSKVVEDDVGDKVACRTKAVSALVAESNTKGNLESKERGLSNGQERISEFGVKNENQTSSKRTEITDVEIVDDSSRVKSDKQDLASTSSTPADCGPRDVNTQRGNTPSQTTDSLDAAAANDVSPKNASGKGKRPDESPAVHTAMPEVTPSPAHNESEKSPHAGAETEKMPYLSLPESETPTPVSSTTLEKSSSPVVHREKTQNALGHDMYKTNVDLTQSEGVLSIDLRCPSADDVGNKDGKTSQSIGKESRSKSQSDGVVMLLEACNLAVNEDGLSPKKSSGDMDIANVNKKRSSADIDSALEVTSADEVSGPVSKSPRLSEEILEGSSTVENALPRGNHVIEARDLNGRDTTKEARDSRMFSSVVSPSITGRTHPDPEVKSKADSVPLKNSDDDVGPREQSKSVPRSVIENSGSQVVVIQSVPSGSVSNLYSAPTTRPAEQKIGGDHCLHDSERRDQPGTHVHPTGTDGQEMDSAVKETDKAAATSEAPALPTPVEAAVGAKAEHVAGGKNVAESPSRAATVVGNKVNHVIGSTAENFLKVENATSSDTDGPSEDVPQATAILQKTSVTEGGPLAVAASEEDCGKRDMTEDVVINVTEAGRSSAQSLVCGGPEGMKPVDCGGNAGTEPVPEMPLVGEGASETVMLAKDNLLKSVERSEKPCEEKSLAHSVVSVEDDSGVAMSFGKVTEDGVRTVLSSSCQVDLLTDTLQDDHDDAAPADVCKNNSAVEFVHGVAEKENELSTAAVFGNVLENGVVPVLPLDYYRDLQADAGPFLDSNNASQLRKPVTDYDQTTNFSLETGMGINRADTLQGNTSSGVSSKTTKDFVNPTDDRLVGVVKEIEPDREVSVGKIIDHGVVTVLDVGHQGEFIANTVQAEEILTQTFCKDDSSESLAMHKDIDGGHHKSADELLGSQNGAKDNENRLSSPGSRGLNENAKSGAGSQQTAVREDHHHVEKTLQGSLYAEQSVKKPCTEKEKMLTDLGMKHEFVQNCVGADTPPKNGPITSKLCLGSNKITNRETVTGNHQGEKGVAAVATNCTDSADVAGDLDIGPERAPSPPLQELDVEAKSKSKAEEILEEVFSDLAVVTPMITNVISGAGEEPMSSEPRFL